MSEIPPMGVSQWKEYGKKYGYWDYFKGKFEREDVKELREKMQVMVGNLVYANENETVDKYIKQILNELRT